MGTAITGLLGIVVGVLLGGGVQLLVSGRERKAQSKRAARLLYGDCQLAIEAVWLMSKGIMWDAKSAPPVDGWRRHREALADAMDGPAFQKVDGAFYQVTRLDAWLQTDDSLADIEVMAEDTLEELREAGRLLLVEGFSERERERMEKAANDTARKQGERAFEQATSGRSTRPRGKAGRFRRPATPPRRAN